jgi:hypothetical protein
VKFVVEKVSVVQVSLRVFRLSPVSIFSPNFHNNICLRVALKGRTNGRNLEAF